jgi:hypothetical protein
MRDRRQLVASKLRVQLAPRKGTKIYAELPLEIPSHVVQATTLFAGR